MGYLLSFCIACGSFSTTLYAVDVPTIIRQHTLQASDGHANDGFGSRVAVGGNRIVIGANQHSSFELDAGAAYVFDTNSGAELVRLTPDDSKAGDFFGISVAVQDNLALVGSLNGSENRTGAAYLFNLDTGDQLRRFTANDGATFDRFGSSVTMHGNLALIGAPRADEHGAAYVFDLTTGAQLAKLIPTGGGEGDDFGAFEVGLNSQTALIGSWVDDDRGQSSGSAFLFDLQTNAQLTQILPTDVSAGALFGVALSLRDTYAVVGASGDDMQRGSAYLIDVSKRTLVEKYVSPDGDRFDQFGSSVAFSENVLIISAHSDDNAQGRNAGAIYLYPNMFESNFIKVAPDDLEPEMRFGFDIAIDQQTLVVGAPYQDSHTLPAGKAYVFLIVPEPSSIILVSLAFLAKLGLDRVTVF